MARIIEFSDRYTALGIPYPDPKTMCLGQCEGTGFVPIHAREKDPVFVSLWKKAEEREPTDDGWHFVTCPACEGSRLRPSLSD